jgi:hypothetical protein
MDSVGGATERINQVAERDGAAAGLGATFRSMFYETPRAVAQDVGRAYSAVAQPVAGAVRSFGAGLMGEPVAAQPVAASPERPRTALPARQPAGYEGGLQERTFGADANRAVSPNDRMSAMGWSARDVQGAPTVTRFDRPGQSPIYTNVVGDTADWVAGGMKPGVSALGGGQEAIERMARANLIRQSYLDSQAGADGGPRGGAIGGGGSRKYGLQFARRREDRAADRAQRSALAQQGFENATALENLRAQNAASLENMRAERDAPLNDARVSLAAEQVKALQRQGGPQLRQRPSISREEALLLQNMPDGGVGALQSLYAQQAEYDAALKALAPLLAAGVPLEEIMADERFAPYAMRLYQFGTPQGKGYAEGGVVQGAMYGQVPQAAQAMPEVLEYRDYAMGAKQLGLPAIPFEQFTMLRAQARQVPQMHQPMRAMGFANGGEIPAPNDVSGKMVIDTDPNAPTDSIPAVVDGQMPAALDSGEFVIPKDVVAFFGTDKLNKMIAQARKGEMQE